MSARSQVTSMPDSASALSAISATNNRKVAIVTGGTGGIGIHTAAGLLSATDGTGCKTVIVTGRDRGRGESGLIEIKKMVV